MARFTVPSVSPPSTPGSSGSASPHTSQAQISGPNTFRAPVATPSADGDDADDERSPSMSPLYTTGPSSFRVPSSHSTPSTGSGRGTRSPSGSPESGSKTRSRNSEDGERARETAPVPEGALYTIPSVSVPSSSSSSSKSDRNSGSGNPADPNTNNNADYTPSSPASSSDHTDLNFSDEDLPTPRFYQPHLRPGRLGAFQPPLSKSLTLLSERPGKLPEHTARSPTNPGFEWGDGVAWWHPAGGVVREIYTPGLVGISEGEARAVAEVMGHENLVKVMDFDGFRDEQAGVRMEVLYEFCAGGTLNKLLLSRRPEAPVLKPRRLAANLPTREVMLGLPEDLVWHVMLSLLRTTYWLHDRRRPVVHCAIDPANVFFTAPRPNDRRPLVRRYGLVKLSNFSKAVNLPQRADPDINDDEETQAWCNMFEHMITEPYQETGYEAPELLGMLGEDEISADKVLPGPCSDIFSIGATCFAMMTGKTIWDVLLERRFIARSLAPGGIDHAVLEEKWRFADFDERTELLRPVLQGEQVLGSALSAFYSTELRALVSGLLNLDPEMRGESAALLDEAEETFAEISSDTDLRGMQRRWRKATRSRAGSKEEAEKAMQDFEQVFGSESLQAMRRSEARGPLMP